MLLVAILGQALAGPLAHDGARVGQSLCTDVARFFALFGLKKRHHPSVAPHIVGQLLGDGEVGGAILVRWLLVEVPNTVMSNRVHRKFAKGPGAGFGHKCDVLVFDGQPLAFEVHQRLDARCAAHVVGAIVHHGGEKVVPLVARHQFFSHFVELVRGAVGCRKSHAVDARVFAQFFKGVQNALARCGGEFGHGLIVAVGVTELRCCPRARATLALHFRQHRATAAKHQRQAQADDAGHQSRVTRCFP